MITPKRLEDDYKPVYAVKDEMSGFGAPMVYDNGQVALRDFAEAVKDPTTVLSKFKEDYALYRIGQYNFEYGTLIPEDVPVLVVRAKNIVVQEVVEDGKE